MQYNARPNNADRGDSASMSMRRKTTVAAACLLLGLAVTLPALADSKARRPSVVVITVDALRADGVVAWPDEA